MKICVYGASSNDIAPEYLAAGQELGEAIARHGWTLVFGGGTTGMMGAAARGVEAAGGQSIGVAPLFFHEPGVLHETCTKFIYTDTMRERKEKMEKISDGFIVTPGGIGTLEEFFEVLTLKQLHQLSKPICILNINGCYDALYTLLEDLVRDGFMSVSCLDLVYMSSSISDIMTCLEQNAKKEALE